VQIATSGDPDAILAVSSISKSITATGIALLIQQGKLRLDSTLGELLPAYFRAHGQTLDESLQGITIQRLLTHSAGLRPNGVTDPIHGLSSGRVIRLAGGGSAHFFQYIVVADAAKSNGSSSFVYSNLSYLILGMVIEAVSGQKYVDFCQQNIFIPEGVHSAQIPTDWTIVSPFAGWHMNMADVLRAWDAFDYRSPTVLTRATLGKTLLGRLGTPRGDAADVYYTLGANVRQRTQAGSYVANHNGIGDFMSGEPKFYTFVEKSVPGPAWIVVFDAGRSEVDSTERRAVNDDIRAIVENDLAQ